jgi:hypothetical protein
MIALGALAFAAVLIVIGGGIAGGARTVTDPDLPKYSDLFNWTIAVPAIIWTVLLAGALTGYGAAFLVALGWAIIWLGMAITETSVFYQNLKVDGGCGESCKPGRMKVAGLSLEIIAIMIAFLALFPWGTLKKMGVPYIVASFGWIVAFIGTILWWSLNRKLSTTNPLQGIANQTPYLIGGSIPYFVAYTAAAFAIYTVSPHAHGAAAVLTGWVTLSACNTAFDYEGIKLTWSKSHREQWLAGILLVIIGAFIISVAAILVVGRTVAAADEAAPHDTHAQPHEGVPLQNTAAGV